MATPSAFQLCADFTLFPENTLLGPSFTLAAIDFAQPNGSDLTVGTLVTEKGLRFPDQGLEITLPVAASRVDMRLGLYAGPVTIVALDAAGNVVRTQIANFHNVYRNVRVLAPDITTLVLKGGNNEAALVWLCISVVVC